MQIDFFKWKENRIEIRIFRLIVITPDGFSSQFVAIKRNGMKQEPQNEITQ